jgi:IS30 family transposase
LTIENNLPIIIKEQKIYTTTYFERPYTSQDKETVKNRINVIRRFFPKKTDLREVSNKRIKEVKKTLNYRTIRKFNYHNTIEVLNNKYVALMGSTQLTVVIKNNN